GPAARLAPARLRAKGGVRPQFRGAHPPPARRPSARSCGDRIPQPALGGPRDRLQPGQRLERCRHRAAGAARARGRPPARAGGVRSFANEPTLELRRSDARESLVAALRELDARLPIEVPVLAGGERVGPADVEVFHSTDPGEPERVVAVATRGGPGVAATA